MTTGAAILVGFVVVALLFDFLNGFNDSANIVATMIASRAMTPKGALVIAACFEFAGPFLFGVAVATTIGQQIVDPRVLTTMLVTAALVAAIVWNLFTWRAGIPSSSSHALIGGLVGSAVTAQFIHHVQNGSFHHIADLASVGQVIHPHGLMKVITALLLSPALGFVAGAIAIKAAYFFARNEGPGPANRFFKRMQIPASMALALSHGANDAQKTMGLIAMALFASGATRQFVVPMWVVAACAGAIALGTAVGGHRQIKTIGSKFYKIRPIHGFTTQVSSTLLIVMASVLGGPVSTTHVVSSAVMGAGSAEQLSKVRWGVGKQILAAWVLTIPAAAVVAALVYAALYAVSS